MNSTLPASLRRGGKAEITLMRMTYIMTNTRKMFGEHCGCNRGANQSLGIPGVCSKVRSLNSGGKFRCPLC
jgi:hypothetical protein